MALLILYVTILSLPSVCASTKMNIAGDLCPQTGLIATECCLCTENLHVMDTLDQSGGAILTLCVLHL